ncbi:hypothetical protein RP20_CCG025424 [Aedes albopictus]|nr:hypothetical protein RP20_CCG025424 [Aedes albopictus]
MGIRIGYLRNSLSVSLFSRFTVLSLKDLKIFVPDAVIMGNAATLTCQFELEKASLYSVRWYFEGEEFYRYVPKESPPARTFPVSGITVDNASVIGDLDHDDTDESDGKRNPSEQSQS